MSCGSVCREIRVLRLVMSGRDWVVLALVAVYVERSEFYIL